MRIELLHIVDCPNTEIAAERLRAALDETGHQKVQVTRTELTSAPVSASIPFSGSPTILIDGEDAFPSDGRTPDLACRVYPTPDGLAGSPTLDQLVAVLSER
ncbi:thioredoxin family protein [Plantibacter sp. Mn2098]|uniref:thioredoxin family protein n=1 Tax=Plantibacter sp. Mn2098 TaxID=3395266 RepID=UPI003BC4F96D